jgi:hypothetical protein
MYGPAVRYKPDFQDNERESCINVSGLLSGAICSGPSWVSARIRGSLGERPQRAKLAPSLLVAPGRPFIHLFIFVSQTSAGMLLIKTPNSFSILIVAVRAVT